MKKQKKEECLFLLLLMCVMMSSIGISETSKSPTRSPSLSPSRNPTRLPSRTPSRSPSSQPDGECTSNHDSRPGDTSEERCLALSGCCYYEEDDHCQACDEHNCDETSETYGVCNVLCETCWVCGDCDDKQYCDTKCQEQEMCFPDFTRAAYESTCQKKLWESCSEAIHCGENLKCEESFEKGFRCVECDNDSNEMWCEFSHKCLHPDDIPVDQTWEEACNFHEHDFAEFAYWQALVPVILFAFIKLIC